RVGSSDPVELRTSLDELVDGFDLSKFGAAPTKFDVQDVFPLTARHLQSLALADVADHVAALGVPDDMAHDFWMVARDNITTLADLQGWWNVIHQGADPIIATEDAEFVGQAMALLPDGPFDGETWGTWTKAVKAKTGRKGRALFMPLRKALTGLDHGPDMARLLPLLQNIKRTL
ncbi:MAG: glutamate--tRNA ligase, partial [Pseudomonadota bacterium]